MPPSAPDQGCAACAVTVICIFFASCFLLCCCRRWVRRCKKLSKHAIPAPAAWLDGTMHSGGMARATSRQLPPEHMGLALLSSTEQHAQAGEPRPVSTASAAARAEDDDAETRLANSALLAGCVGFLARHADAHTARLVTHARRRVEDAAIGTPVGATPEGNYVGVYWQYGRAHPLAAQHLRCALGADGTSGSATGHGADDVGSFGVRGAFSGARLSLTKRYVRGTGDPHENKGHAVELRLVCCALDAALPERAMELQRWGMPPGAIGFYGTWHVRTARYRGDAEMVLWLPPSAVPVGFVIAQSSEPVAVGLPPNPTLPPPPPAVSPPAMMRAVHAPVPPAPLDTAPIGMPMHPMPAPPPPPMPMPPMAMPPMGMPPMGMPVAAQPLSATTPEPWAAAAQAPLPMATAVPVAPVAPVGAVPVVPTAPAAPTAPTVPVATAVPV